MEETNKYKGRDIETVKNLVSKLKAMAERGEKGERDVAFAKLKEILKKYNLKEQGVLQPLVKNYVFKVSDWHDHLNLLVQCIQDTKPGVAMDGDKKGKKLFVELNDIEYLEVMEKVSFYWEEYTRLRASVFAAFVLKNKIGIIGNSDSNCKNEFNVDEIVECMKVINEKPFKDNSQRSLT
jgi:hypothetical protein